jgi:hypothetical protein
MVEYKETKLNACTDLWEQDEADKNFMKLNIKGDEM